MDNKIDNIVLEEKPKKLKSLLVFKIVGSIIYALPTILFASFAIWWFIDLSMEENSVSLGVGKVFAIIFLAIGAAACLIIYLAPIILGIIGLIRTTKKLEKGKRAGNLVWFILMIALPIVSLALEVGSIFLVKYI